MSNRRKIMRDRQFPDASQINSQQDLSRLMSDHGLMKKLMMKKIILWSASAVIASTVVAGVVLSGGKEVELGTVPAAHEDSVRKISCIAPPIEGKEQAFTTFILSNSKGGKFRHATGTEIIIPAGAFIRNDGSGAGDTVRIQYREFHTPLDVFLSGIPMQYDSAGLSRTFETAGMFEILAFDGVHPLQLDPQKQIDVTMASHTNDTKFNLYSLDTLSGQWTHQGKDKIADNTREFNRTAKPVKRVADTRVQAVIPVMADPKKYNFCINFDKNEFPELQAFDHVLFEVTDNSFKPAFYKVQWERIRLLKEGDGNYNIQLHKADTTITVSAHPVFAKDDYENAKASFEKAQQSVEKKETINEMERTVQLDKMEREYSQASSNLLSTTRTMIRLTTGRNFRINTLGIHNLDFPMPSVMQLAVRMANEARGNLANATEITYNTIYMVEKGKNAVFTYKRGEPLRFNPSSQNLVWTINSNSQIAFFNSSELSRIKNGEQSKSMPIAAANQDQALERIKKFSEM